jgi:TPR repeat protein
VLEDDLTHPKPKIQKWASACRDDDAGACERLATHYLHSDELRAVRYYRRSCEREEPKGCYGWAYVIADPKSKAVERDIEQAAALFEQGCDAGVRSACSMLGLTLYWGRTKVGVQKTRSIPYFRKACDAGDGRVACFNLGMMIHHGVMDGSPADSAKLFAASCDDGEPKGCYNAGLLTHEAKDPATHGPALVFFDRGCAHDGEHSCIRAAAQRAKTNAASKPTANAPHPTRASAKRSAIPTLEEWTAAPVVSEPEVIAASCEAKRVREWLRVSCRKPLGNGAQPTGLKVTKGGTYDTYTFAKRQITSLVTTFMPGVKLEVVFTWSDGSERRLVSAWPAGATAPKVAATFLSP